MSGLITPPAAIADTVRATAAARAAQALLLVDATVTVGRALAAADIRYLALKGVTLSCQLYGNPTARGGRDVDILVEPGKLPLACAILEKLGYTRPSEDRAKDQINWHTAKEIGMVHRERRTLVELHSRLHENAALQPIAFDELWANRDAVSIGGYPVPALGRADLAPYLIVHGARHCWSRLLWLSDIAQLMQDEDAARQLARTMQGIGLTALDLHCRMLIYHWFGLDRRGSAVPGWRTRAMNRIAEWCAARRDWNRTSPRGSWQRFWLGSVLSRAMAYLLRSEAGYYKQQLVQEFYSPSDRMLVALPRQLHWAYPLLRPVGWIVRRWRGAR